MPTWVNPLAILVVKVTGLCKGKYGTISKVLNILIIEVHLS